MSRRSFHEKVPYWVIGAVGVAWIVLCILNATGVIGEPG